MKDLEFDELHLLCFGATERLGFRFEERVSLAESRVREFCLIENKIREGEKAKLIMRDRLASAKPAGGVIPTHEETH